VPKPLLLLANELLIGIGNFSVLLGLGGGVGIAEVILADIIVVVVVVNVVVVVVVINVVVVVINVVVVAARLAIGIDIAITTVVA